MKDILFLVPLFYSANGVRRMARYLHEDGGRGFSFDVVFACSTPSIFPEARAEAESAGFSCAERSNDGGGEGALWWLQKASGIDLRSYRYVWYFEESCEPIRRGWIRRLIHDMDRGIPLTGWWWNGDGRCRPCSIPHTIQVGAGRMTYYENTADTGLDPSGRPFDGTMDTPGYRDETFVVRSDDFLGFDYPDPRDPFWQKWAGVRTYGVKAERVWWSAEDVERHQIPLPSPNIQWYVLTKYAYVPTHTNAYRSYFRELPLDHRTDPHYRPLPLPLRTLAYSLRPYLVLAAGRLGRGLRR